MFILDTIVCIPLLVRLLQAHFSLKAPGYSLPPTLPAPSRPIPQTLGQCHGVGEGIGVSS